MARAQPGRPICARGAVSLREIIKSSASLEAAAAEFEARHGKRPTTQMWLRAGVNPAPAGLVPPRGGRKPSSSEGALIPVTVKLRPSTIARLEAQTGLSAGLALRQLAEEQERLLTPEQAARASAAAEAVGPDVVAEALTGRR